MSTTRTRIFWSREDRGADGDQLVCQLDEDTGDFILAVTEIKTGKVRYTSTGFQGVGSSGIQANVAGAVYAVAGVRLRPEFQNDPDEKLVIEKVSLINGTPDDFEWALIEVPTIAGPLPVFQDVLNSHAQEAQGEGSNPSLSLVTLGLVASVVDGGYVKSSQQGGSIILPVSSAIEIVGQTALWLVVRPLSPGADIHGSISWREQT